MRSISCFSRPILIEAVDLDFGRGWLAVSGFKLGQIALNARLDLLRPLGRFGLREIPVARVDRFELAAVDGNRCCRSGPTRLRTTMNSGQTLRTPTFFGAAPESPGFDDAPFTGAVGQIRTSWFVNWRQLATSASWACSGHRRQAAVSLPAVSLE
jgi:hypothetical protein